MDFDTDTYDKIIETRNDVKHIRTSIDQINYRINEHDKTIRDLGKCPVEDHENRIRVLEDQQNKWLGRNAVIGFAVLVIIQLISALLPYVRG